MEKENVYVQENVLVWNRWMLCMYWHTKLNSTICENWIGKGKCPGDELIKCNINGNGLITCSGIQRQVWIVWIVKNGIHEGMSNVCVAVFCYT